MRRFAFCDSGYWIEADDVMVYIESSNGKEAIYIKRMDAVAVLALYRACQAALDTWYPGCVSPIPEDEVDADVMRAWSDLQEECRKGMWK